MKTVKLFATLRDLAGMKEIHVPFEDGQTVREFLGTVKRTHPELHTQILDEQGELTGLVHILVQGRNIQWLKGLETVIRAHDTMIFMPPTAGG